MVLLMKVTQAAEALSATNKARNKVSILYKASLQRKDTDTKVLKDTDDPSMEIIVYECKREWSLIWAIFTDDVAAFNAAAVLLKPTSLLRLGLPKVIPTFNLNHFLQGTEIRADLSAIQGSDQKLRHP